MAALFLRPGPDAVVDGKEVGATNYYGVIAIRDATDDTTLDAGTAVAYMLMRGQGVGEGVRGCAQEGRWEGSRGPFGEDGVGGVEVVGGCVEGGFGLVVIGSTAFEDEVATKKRW